MNRRQLVIPLLLTLVLLGCGGDGSTASTTSSGGNTDKSIACGNVTCEDICCPGANECAQDESACLAPNGHGFYMKCDGPEDCASGQVCCIGVGAAAYGSTECGKASDCAEPSYQQAACHGGGDCPAEMTCQPADSASIFVPTLLGCK